MPVKDFDGFIKMCRRDFREHLEGYLNGSGDLKYLLKGMLEQCTSAFEEKALTENLQEEFKLYMEELNKGA